MATAYFKESCTLPCPTQNRVRLDGAQGAHSQLILSCLRSKLVVGGKASVCTSCARLVRICKFSQFCSLVLHNTELYWMPEGSMVWL
jgi:hypothetical protein